MDRDDSKDRASQIPELKQQLEEAAEIYAQAHDALRRAQINETAATTKFNELSKKFDAAVEALRQSAPTGTDWHRTGRAVE